MRKTFTVADIQEIQVAAHMPGVDAVWCIILFKHCTNPVQFYASPTANNDFGKDMYTRLKAGEFGELHMGLGEHFRTQPKEQDEVEEEVIAERDQKLLESDWTEIPARQSAMTDAKKTEWANYRQALRDVTKQNSFPWDVKWPTKP